MEHKHHRNVLYALVFIMLVLQIISFVTLTSHLSKVSSELGQTQEEMKNQSAFYNALINSHQEQNLRNFNDIVQHVGEVEEKVSEQKSTIEQQIKLLKSSQGDFSAVISSAVRSVVTVRTDTSLGTGFVFHEGGYILTNHHVIAGAKRIAVVTHDRKTIEAELIGADKFRDVAILKIGSEYPALEFADSDELEVGNKVIAIGNPLGLSFTVTEGIVSGLEREGPTGLHEYVQTDVSLNPGNSGGPLIDTKGRVVGMNNFKVGEAESLGFALESNTVKSVIATLSEGALTA